jgi:hypothetical protein
MHGPKMNSARYLGKSEAAERNRESQSKTAFLIAAAQS